MQNFIVHLNGTKTVFDSAEMHRWLTNRLNDFMRENYLQQAYQSHDKNQMWLVWRADDQELLRMIMKPIVLKTGIEIEVTQLRLKF